MSILLGDCKEQLKNIEAGSVDLIYLDPPFFTQKTQKLKTRDNTKAYSFNDSWTSIDDYYTFIRDRLIECHRVLKSTGSIFLHCDKYASHYLRMALDEVFGMENFQSEIVWSYKRWSNSKSGLLNNHQTIYFYSKTKDFKFNRIYTDYSETTNVDQILQERIRDEHNRSKYKFDENGNAVTGKAKKDVPLSDVWEIPFLNPKAKERTGYPTQKPILLLEQIIRIASDEGDIVLDPFCGSGTTVVAAELMNRWSIGIDASQDAVELTKQRLENPVRTSSHLLEKGKEKYINKTAEELAFLRLMDAVPVQRNSGIDGFLKEYYVDKPVPVKIQSANENLDGAMEKLRHASKKRGCLLSILIRTKHDHSLFMDDIKQNNYDNILVIDSYDLQINDWITENRNTRTY